MIEEIVHAAVLDQAVLLHCDHIVYRLAHYKPVRRIEWGTMQDPTRIAPTLEALRRAWEGEPDLSLPTLFAMLANEGLGWGASDADLVAALETRAAVRPGFLPAEGTYLIRCDRALVTVDGRTAIVRGQSQPVVWEYSRARPTGPGRPLVLADAAGIEHRLGLVESISRVDLAALARAGRPLAGLKRRSLGERVYVLRTADPESTILLDHGLHVFTPARRTLAREDLSWQRIVTGAVGETLTVELPGARMRDFGTVTQILIAAAEVG